MCLSRNKTNSAYLCNLKFYYITVEGGGGVAFKGVKIIKACSRDNHESQPSRGTKRSRDGEKKKSTYNIFEGVGASISFTRAKPHP